MLIRGPHLPQHLLQLILGDQDPHGSELHDHIGHARADQARGGQVGGGPWIGRAFHHLMPLGEGPAGGQLHGIVGGGHFLEGIAAPGHRAHPLAAEPDQHVAGLARNAGGDHAAGDADQGGESGVLSRQARRGVDALRDLRLQPTPDVADLLGGGNIARGENLTLEEERRPGGVEWQQQGSRAARGSRGLRRVQGRFPR